MTARGIGPERTELDQFDQIPAVDDATRTYAVRSLHTARPVTGQRKFGAAPVSSTSATEDGANDAADIKDDIVLPVVAAVPSNGPHSGLRAFFAHRINFTDPDNTAVDTVAATTTAVDTVATTTTTVDTLATCASVCSAASSDSELNDTNIPAHMLVCNGASAAWSPDTSPDSSMSTHKRKQDDRVATDATDIPGPQQQPPKRQQSDYLGVCYQNMLDAQQQSATYKKGMEQAQDKLVYYKRIAELSNENKDKAFKILEVAKNQIEKLTLAVNSSTELIRLNTILSVAKDVTISTQKASIRALQETVAVVTETQTESKEIHDAKMDLIRESVNDLRYVDEFSTSLSRGATLCPVSRNELHPKETVLMLRADCSCNCMVQYDSAGPLIRNNMDGEEIKCMTCNIIVDSIKVTTVENAEKIFAWGKVEEMTGCDNLDELYTIRAEKLEKDKADQVHQNKYQLRQTLDVIRSAIPAATPAV
ncbi:hypothetical protein T484DRAFT_1847637 [Baffinella frigidus]|nr:hypothetical protein T484DRAFT_1847637 [Cryptophyta sp. CCMP2293]